MLNFLFGLVLFSSAVTLRIYATNSKMTSLSRLSAIKEGFGPTIYLRPLFGIPKSMISLGCVLTVTGNPREVSGLEGGHA